MYQFDSARRESGSEMSWAVGYDEKWKRDIGYGVPAMCDYPGCEQRINRGLGYVCGGEPYGGEYGCGLYFCEWHKAGFPPLCERCCNTALPFEPTPDVPEWVEHKATDASWAEWRAEQAQLS